MIREAKPNDFHLRVKAEMKQKGVGLNDPCPCGSTYEDGTRRKAKHCCIPRKKKAYAKQYNEKQKEKEKNHDSGSAMKTLTTLASTAAMMNAH